MTTITTLHGASVMCAYGFCGECWKPDCVHWCHLPESDDTVWTALDEDASWVEDDTRQRRRAR